MPSYSLALLMGHLAKEPHMRHTAKGTAVATLVLAVRDNPKDPESAGFFDVTVWGAQAEAVKEYCTKGQCLLVEGSLRQERWEADGQQKTRVVVNARHVTFLGRGKGAAPADDAGPGADGEDVPF